MVVPTTISFPTCEAARSLSNALIHPSCTSRVRVADSAFFMIRRRQAPIRISFALLLVLAGTSFAADRRSTSSPITAANHVFLEIDGMVFGEAEQFVRQEHTSVRAWHRITTSALLDISPDGDPSHADTASGAAYIECLPDTRRTHDDPLIVGENFSNEPGKLAVVSYRIRISTPGRYYVWLRTLSTNSEDNGVHVGLDGEWPESGLRWQTTNKNAWAWDCRQRTNEVHIGVPMKLYLDIATAGEHTFQISMREDGVEIDQWLLARDIAYRPEGALPPAPSPPSKQSNVNPVVFSSLHPAFALSAFFAVNSSHAARFAVSKTPNRFNRKERREHKMLKSAWHETFIFCARNRSLENPTRN